VAETKRGDSSMKWDFRLSYGIMILAGLMFASFGDALYHGGRSPGYFIYYLFDLFFGRYRAYWFFHCLVLVIPLAGVNVVNFVLYRFSRFPAEKTFFLLLALVLNSVVFFVAGNVLIIYFI